MVIKNFMLPQRSIFTIDDLLSLYDAVYDLHPRDILKLDFQIHKIHDFQKLSPILELADIRDAQIISSLFADVYRGTYPYKKMENPTSIKEMIRDANQQWLLIKIPPNKIAGCFGINLNFKEKRTYMYGLLLKPKYQKIVDIIKTFIGTLIYLCKTYKKKILIYHGEARTNDTASQFGTSICGMKPIAFFPNKDIFFNRIESNFMIIAYYNEILRTMRREDPRIIPQVQNCFQYSNKRYNLGTPLIENPDIKFENEVINNVRRTIMRKRIPDKLGNANLEYFIKNSDSYIKFFLNPYSKSIEKTRYHVERLEELHAFLQELRNFIQNNEINYFECFVSAYEPAHQKIFYKMGFLPRGYIPSWKYDSLSNIFEDRVVFNYYTGNINPNMKLIPETKELLKFLNFIKKEPIPVTSDLIQ